MGLKLGKCHPGDLQAAGLGIDDYTASAVLVSTREHRGSVVWRKHAAVALQEIMIQIEVRHRVTAERGVKHESVRGNMRCVTLHQVAGDIDGDGLTVDFSIPTIGLHLHDIALEGRGRMRLEREFPAIWINDE